MFLKHCESQTFPALLTDRMGFAWIGVQQTNDISQEPVAYHIFGPFFTVEATESYLRKLCSNMKLSDKMTNSLIVQLKLIPSIIRNYAVRYAVMIYYGIYGKSCSVSDVEIINECVDIPADEQWHGRDFHGTWEFEKTLFDAVQKGRLLSDTEIIKSNQGKIGTMIRDNPLRQSKNEQIIFTALCARAAILGGVSPEGAYNLSDYYIQLIEACRNVQEAEACGTEMYQVIVERVIKCKMNKEKYSTAICTAQEYVETHIMEKIVLEDLAAEIGYAPYYLSNLFQKETGESFNQYVKRQKIELSKKLLKNPALKVADISEQLAFSSPSFFGSTFQKLTGVTPAKYREHPDM